MTVQELIYPALRLAAITKMAGRTANVYELADALAALNAMLDSWNTERLTVYAIVRQVFAMSPVQASYTLGPDADWNATRPVKIEHAGVIEGDKETPLEIMRNAEQWRDISSKSLTSSTPTTLYDDRDFPAARIYVWPVPTVENSIALYVWQAIASFAALGDAVSLPPGYTEAIQYNLAERLAAANPENQISPFTVKNAAQSKAKIKRANIPTPIMQGDPALVGYGRFDILTGEYR